MSQISRPYSSVLAHPAVRRLLPGYTASALGDGMSIVAVSWLAIELAPQAERGLWVALYVVLLALSSILHSWGHAGTYTFLARTLPERDHLAGLIILHGSAILVLTLNATGHFGPLSRSSRATSHCR